MPVSCSWALRSLDSVADGDGATVKVYVIQGWFGQDEWIEGIYADQQKAEFKMRQLWAERRSEVLAPDYYIQGLCKFDVVEHEVIS